jgi:hypothetical protein
MLPKEAKWINTIINKYLLGVDGEVINLGSSTLDFISYNQPFIKDLVLDPLLRNFQVTNVDIKSDPNVQLVANFLTEAGQTLIKEKGAKVFLVSNLLEHIPNAIEGIEKVKKLMEPKTYLILTGPKSFPYHPDPIDNMFRPSISEIRGYFEKEFEIVKLDLIRNGTVFTSSFFGRSTKKSKAIIESKGGLLNLALNPNIIYRVLRNLVYPASAFCLLAIKK